MGNLVVKKCDRGVPLPDDSDGTFFTWDTWDEVTKRSVSKHRTEREAVYAAETMNAVPFYRKAFEAIVAGGCSHTAILDGLVYVDLVKHEIPRSPHDRDPR